MSSISIKLKRERRKKIKEEDLESGGLTYSLPELVNFQKLHFPQDYVSAGLFYAAEQSGLTKPT